MLPLSFETSEQFSLIKLYTPIQPTTSCFCDNKSFTSYFIFKQSFGFFDTDAHLKILEKNIKYSQNFQKYPYIVKRVGTYLCQ